MVRRRHRLAALVLAALPLACRSAPIESAGVRLFDGVSLHGWRATEFGGEGSVHVEEGRLVLEMGSPLTGITWAGAARELPTRDYEIDLTATRVNGTDFFCGLTFPVGESHCSLVVGGWGGALVGLSCLDGEDAAHNATRRTMRFVDGRPYRIRVRVGHDRIRAWIDDAPVVDEPILGRTISIRPEVAPSRPLGIASFVTTAALSDIRLRRLGPDPQLHAEPSDRSAPR